MTLNHPHFGDQLSGGYSVVFDDFIGIFKFFFERVVFAVEFPRFSRCEGYERNNEGDDGNQQSDVG